MYYVKGLTAIYIAATTVALMWHARRSSLAQQTLRLLVGGLWCCIHEMW